MNDSSTANALPAKKELAYTQKISIDAEFMSSRREECRKIFVLCDSRNPQEILFNQGITARKMCQW